MRRRMASTLAALAAMMVWLSACGGQGGGAAAPTGTPSSAQMRPSDTPSPVPAAATIAASPGSNTSYPAEANVAVTAAKADLAKQLNADAASISVVKVDERIWNDLRLGCPPPDMKPIATNTPGYAIILQAAGKNYEYHTDKLGKVILCGGNNTAAGAASELKDKVSQMLTSIRTNSQDKMWLTFLSSTLQPQAKQMGSIAFLGIPAQPPTNDNFEDVQVTGQTGLVRLRWDWPQGLTSYRIFSLAAQDGNWRITGVSGTDISSGNSDVAKVDDMQKVVSDFILKFENGIPTGIGQNEAQLLGVQNPPVYVDIGNAVTTDHIATVGTLFHYRAGEALRRTFVLKQSGSTWTIQNVLQR